MRYCGGKNPERKKKQGKMRASDGSRMLKHAVLFLVLALSLMIQVKAVQASDDRTVRIGCFPLNGFFDIAADGTVTGYGADYTDAVAAHAGWNYQYVPYSSWVSALDALSENKIDLLAPAQHTPERDELYTFDSFPIGTEYGSLLTLSTNDTLTYEDYSAFNGRKVGCVETLVFLDDFKEYETRNGFSVELSYYKDTPALVAALNSGEVDAIVANMMVKTASMKLLARFGAASFYYMFSERGNDLRGEVNQVIDKLTSNHPQFQGELSGRYFSDFIKLPYSREELDYIAQCGTLKTACASNYAPFSYVDGKTGLIDGVDRAILEKISEISGLKFSYEAVPEGGGSETFYQEQGITLIAGVENDETISLHNSNYTDPYLTVSKYFVGQTDTVFDSSLPMKVAVISAADAQISAWKQFYPEFTFMRCSSMADCLDKVRSGDADMMLEDRYSLENLLAAPCNQDLKILPAEALTGKICFKIAAKESAEEEILSSILNKAIRQISDSDTERYISDYMQAARYQYNISDFIYQYRFPLLFAGFVFLAVMVTIFFLNRSGRKVRQAIKENETKLRHITNNIKGGVIVLKPDEGMKITYANDGFLGMIGCSREEFEKSENGSYLAYVHKEDLPVIKDAIASEKPELSLEVRVLKKDGKYISALFNCTLGQLINGERELYCVIMDMTEQKKLLERLRIENRRTELILGAVDEIFYEVNCQTNQIHTSSRFQEKLGWTLPDRYEVGKPEGLDEMWKTSREEAKQLHQDTKKMLVKKESVTTTLRLECRQAGAPVWCEVQQHPILGENGEIASVIGLIRNVDEIVKERERLIERAKIDPLTGLYNKEAFVRIVKEVLQTQPGSNHALLFIDLDHFKSVNDTLGHLTGDRAICEAADKLRIIFSNYDVISRFGGDEFCVLVKNIPMETLRGKLEWMMEKLRTDYSNGADVVRITCSCGVACTKYAGNEYGHLLECADQALYASKENGRNQYTFYRDEIS
ncbi:MAG: diguanylate cyclase [Lachnospiraceae bacterium]|nr:diguanylate cyclase [Lachnospiraceae bacterium]